MISSLRQWRADASLSAIVAGFLAVLISYAGPLVVVYQAAHVAGLSPATTASWIWAISIGSGVSGLVLSVRWRVPIIAAWSTPGAALLVSMLPGTPLAEAVGAYLFSAVLVMAVGLSGAFDRWIDRIPKGIAAGLLAGVLLRFGTQLFTSLSLKPTLVLLMLVTFLLGKRWLPRYAIALVMLVGMGMTLASGNTSLGWVALSWVTPEFIAPEWRWHTVLSMGLPLALVSLTGQLVPGMAVLQTADYQVKAGAVASLTGLLSLLLAPFGAHGVNLGAITAALCTGKDAHEQPERRYIAGMACGLFYIAIGLLGGTLAQLFQALPAELIASLAGLALLGAISTGLVGMAQHEAHRDASVITFLVTASGMSWLGLGAAFWGLVLGGLAYGVLHRR